MTYIIFLYTAVLKIYVKKITWLAFKKIINAWKKKKIDHTSVNKLKWKTYHSDGVNWIDNCEEEDVVRFIIVFSETLIDTYYSSERIENFNEVRLTA